MSLNVSLTLNIIRGLLSNILMQFHYLHVSSSCILFLGVKYFRVHLDDAIVMLLVHSFLYFCFFCLPVKNLEFI